MSPYVLFPVVWIVANSIYSITMYIFLKDRLFKEKYVTILKVSLVSLWLISLLAIAVACVLYV
ncbi:hypothetical protein [Niabella drilacis]|uniref:Uncharacterized protein n=1 Tax=Niabella drilacis (strain DSM 25811 / CCM 8410 / CCUG 62505 / LMG 26954 / E90) TaxID=1285928 RepID=A0A1G6IQJ8_NIADE|nr:hypothetical protein [Niabella drilacis]SDC08026.1 hypothetical protein SAMN04487894_101282 [Niabella drilacis]